MLVMHHISVIAVQHWDYVEWSVKCQSVLNSEQLFTWHLPLCSKPRLRLSRTSYLHWPNYISLQSLLLSHLSASLYPALPRFLNCLAVPLLPLSFTPNLTTVILITINSLSLNYYPVSSTSRTILHVLLLKLLCHVISLPSYALSTGS